MVLAFDSQALRTICESEVAARTSLGDAVADKLKHRLADLQAARSIEDLPVGRPRIFGNDGKHIAIELCDGQSLVFVANHTNNPVTQDGVLEWPKVSRIKIVRIGSEHG